LVKTTEEALKKTIQNVGKLGTNALNKSIKKISDNKNAIESELSKEMPKDVLDKINNAVPKGTKVSDFDGAKLEKELSNANDPKALAKKMNVDTKIFDLLS
jgi:hypothetical protein